MTFPDTPLNLDVQFLLGGTWTSVRPDVRKKVPITITGGRQDESAQTTPGSCKLQLNNAGGKYTRVNPLGPYYGLLTKSTPMRVMVFEGSSRLWLPGGSGDRISTPDTAALDITGDLDIRLDVRLDGWSTGQTQELIGKYDTTTNQRSYRLLINQTGQLALTWSTTGSDFIEVFSTEATHVDATGRLAIRATLDANNGAGGRTITFHTAPTLAGPWTQLGDQVVQAGTTSVFAGTAPLEIGDISNLGFTQAGGLYYGFELRNGINGTVVASADFTVPTPGATSFTDGAGRVWTLAGAAEFTRQRTRFLGYVSEWPTEWTPGEHYSWTDITASGITRRLAQGSSPLQSTLRRRIPSAVPAPLAYWPMEDDRDAVRAYSPLGIAPLITGGLSFASDDSLGGSDALPTLGAVASITGRIPGASAGGWHTEMAYKLGQMPSSEATMLRAYVSATGSTVTSVRVRVSTAGIRVQALDDDDGVIANVLFNTPAAITDFAGVWNRLQIFSYVSGGTTNVVAAWRNIVTGLYWYATTAYTGGAGRITQVRGTYASAMQGMSIGHLAVWDVGGSSTTTPGITIFEGADDGFAGERAGTRFSRLCAEEGVASGVIGYSSDTEPMGPQRVATLLALLQDCADADEGAVVEARTAGSVRLRNRVADYGQPVTLALDYLGPGEVAVIKPTDDDQLTRNDVTASRTGGSSGRAVLEDGPMSVLDPEEGGAGRVEDAVTRNLHDDGQPIQHAGWLLHQGTYDGVRVPQVAIRLHKAPALIDAACDLDVRDRLTIARPPVWCGPDDLDLLMEGYTETLRPYAWDMAFNTSPAATYEVAMWDVDRRDTSGSALAAGAGEADTALKVATSVGPRWSTDPGDTPFGVRVGGEVMRVDAVGVVVNGNPFFDGASGWSGEGGATVSPSTAQVHPDGAASLLVVPDGVTAVGGVTADLSAVGSVTAGVVYTTSAWVYSPSGWSDLQASVHWYNAAGAFLSSSATGTGLTVPAGEWTFLTATYTAPATAARARMRVRHGGTPSAVQVYYVWAARLIPVGSGVGVRDDFTRTVTDSWGKTDTGETWTTSGGAAANYSVGGGYGAHSITSLNTNRFCLVPQPYTDFDTTVTARTTVVPTGDSHQAYLIARYLDGSNYYGARLDFTPAATVTLTLIRVVAGVAFSWPTVATGIVYTAFKPIRLRFAGTGTSLMAKGWADGGIEPELWLTTQTDGSLTAAGQMGVRTRLLSGVTNGLPVTMQFRALSLPQTFTVTRSRNGVVKPQPVDADVRLAAPAIRAL